MTGAEPGQVVAQPPSAPDPMFIERCKKLAGRRLLGPAARLFRAQTGCLLHVAWAPCGALRWDGMPPSFCTNDCPPRVRRKSGLADGPCIEFDHGHLDRMLSSGARSHGFRCPLHIRTIARKIQAGDVLLGIAFFQTDEGRTEGGPSAGDLKRMRGLLEFIVHDTVETVMAEIGREMIGRMKEELLASRRTEENLRNALHDVVPAIDGKSAAPQGSTHGELLVSRMVDYANTLYCRPIGLAAFAGEIGMNLSYLSHLFSTTMGMPFRTYLRRLRMDRARGLLSDPLQRISDVAYAVGYTDPNRFRLDFKEHTGLPPSRWRERFVAVETGGGSNDPTGDPK